ncbi:MAG: hypothetical protein KAJ93_02490 [Methanosarcinales archaeon]|nr:hypothetical protein [Methanosarcinales archaeon]
MKLLEGGTILECKSLPGHYESEKMHCLTEGSKRNTVRFVDVIEHMALTDAKIDGTLTHIRIRNTETNETFLRKLTDFRPFNHGAVSAGFMLWVFSW